MKGQNRLLMEVLFFSIGILLTAYVVFSFTNVRDSLTDVSVRSQLTSVGNLVTSAISKASEQPNAIIYLRIPDKVSGFTYSITAENENNNECTAADKCYLNITSSNTISVRKEIFNIQDSNNKIKGIIASSHEFIEIRNIEGDMELAQARVL